MRGMVDRKKLHCENRLKEKRIIEFLSELSPDAKELDISEQSLSAISLDLLLNRLNSVEFVLEVLRLTSTNINDDSLSVLSTALAVNKGLIILDVSKNAISNIGCEDIRFIFMSNP